MKKDKGPNKPKKYVFICKIGDNLNGTAKCVKYRANDILKFDKFIISKFGGWVWIKVYDNINKSNTPLAYYNQKNPPTTKTIN